MFRPIVLCRVSDDGLCPPRLARVSFKTARASFFCKVFRQTGGFRGESEVVGERVWCGAATQHLRVLSSCVVIRRRDFAGLIVRNSRFAINYVLFMFGERMPHNVASTV
ncbi:unnamed protein product [Scytosiphon promiscuus]